MMAFTIVISLWLRLCVSAVLPLLHSVAIAYLPVIIIIVVVAEEENTRSAWFAVVVIVIAIGLKTFFIFIDRMWYRPLIIGTTGCCCFTRDGFFEIFKTHQVRNWIESKAKKSVTLSIKIPLNKLIDNLWVAIRFMNWK